MQGLAHAPLNLDARWAVLREVFNGGDGVASNADVPDNVKREAGVHIRRI